MEFLVFFLKFTVSLFIWELISYIVRTMKLRKQLKLIHASRKRQEEAEIDRIESAIDQVDRQFGLPEDKKWS